MAHIKVVSIRTTRGKTWRDGDKERRIYTCFAVREDGTQDKDPCGRLEYRQQFFNGNEKFGPAFYDVYTSFNKYHRGYYDSMHTAKEKLLELIA